MKKIRCPECHLEPKINSIWICDKCEHEWDTFTSRGECPSCNHQHEETACVRCNKVSPHELWYVWDWGCLGRLAIFVMLVCAALTWFYAISPRRQWSQDLSAFPVGGFNATLNSECDQLEKLLDEQEKLLWRRGIEEEVAKLFDSCIRRWPRHAETCSAEQFNTVLHRVEKSLARCSFRPPKEDWVEASRRAIIREYLLKFKAALSRMKEQDLDEDVLVSTAMHLENEGRGIAAGSTTSSSIELKKLDAVMGQFADASNEWNSLVCEQLQEMVDNFDKDEFGKSYAKLISPPKPMPDLLKEYIYKWYARSFSHEEAGLGMYQLHPITIWDSHQKSVNSRTPVVILETSKSYLLLVDGVLQKRMKQDSN